MCNDYDYVYEVWADLVFNATQTDNPRKRIISLLLEFEGGVYNRALNDVLLSAEKNKDQKADAQSIRSMLLSTNSLPSERNINSADIIPFPDA